MFKIDLPVNRDGPGRRHRLPRALFSVLLLGKQWFAAGSAIHFAWDGSVVQSLAHAQHACVQILVFIFLSWPTKQASNYRPWCGSPLPHFSDEPAGSGHRVACNWRFSW